MKYILVFNTSDRPHVVDEEGHQIDPQAWGCAEKKYVKDLLKEEQLLEIKPDKVKESSNPSVKMAQQEVDKRNQETKDEAAKDSAPDDKSDEEATKPAKKSTKK